MNAAPEVILQVVGLSHVYAGGLRALDGVDFSIGRGAVGLLGPNGAGKSTLMRHLATLQRPTAGQIQFDGVDLVAAPTAVRRRLGYAPQDVGVYPRASAEEMLHHVSALKRIATGDRAVQVEKQLRRVNLWEDRRRRLGDYSGGMIRRFALAQALLGDPDLVLLDEPSAGLDPEERERVLNVVADIAERATVVLSTHVVEDVQSLCSTVIVLAKGRIALQGRTATLLARAEGHIWRRTIARADLADCNTRHHVISSRLNAGAYDVRVFAPASPGDGFEPAEVALDDIYFLALKAG